MQSAKFVSDAPTEKRTHYHLVRGIKHVGMVVPDIAAGEALFAKVFGAELPYRTVSSEGSEMPDAYMRKVNGVASDNASIAVSMLRLGTVPNHDLLEIVASNGDLVPELTDAGATHFSVYCDNLELVGEPINGAGGTTLKGQVRCSITSMVTAYSSRSAGPLGAR